MKLFDVGEKSCSYCKESCPAWENDNGYNIPQASRFSCPECGQNYWFVSNRCNLCDFEKFSKVCSCFREKQRLKRTSVGQMIEKIIYGEKYDYEKVLYFDNDRHYRYYKINSKNMRTRISKQEFEHPFIPEKK